jgi:hypothetical protein
MLAAGRTRFGQRSQPDFAEPGQFVCGDAPYLHPTIVAALAVRDNSPE